MHNLNFLLFKLHLGNKNQDIQISNILKSNGFMSNLTFIQLKRYIVANYTSNTGSAIHRAGSDTFVEHMGSTPIFTGVRIIVLLMPCCWFFCRSLFIFLLFFSIRHCIVCPSIYHLFKYHFGTFKHFSYVLLPEINRYDKFSIIFNKIGIR